MALVQSLPKWQWILCGLGGNGGVFQTEELLKIDAVLAPQASHDLRALGGTLAAALGVSSSCNKIS